MKKIISAILAVTAALTFASCSGAGGNHAPGNAGNDGIYHPGYIKGDGVISPDGKEGLIENSYKSTATDPTSTFSADVDTASYAFFRKLCQSGYSFSELAATMRDSIRTEEMVNYFEYSGNLPENGELFGVKSVISDCPWNPEAKLLMLTLKTEKAVEKKKNNLVFLIDVSGSMNSADKLELLKSSFHYLISSLGADDTVSIVTYSGREEVILEGCAGSKGDMISKAINSLKASGSTNGEAGLKTAYSIAEKYFIPDGNNRIIMASDGDLNVGMSSAEELKNFVSEKRRSGVYLSVLGFGTGNYRDGNMEAIADNGNGVYYYIDSDTEAEKVFCTDLLSTLYTVGSDVKLQITFDPKSVSQYRLVGYENRLLNNEDFEDDTKDAGEIGAGHSVTVLYELITAAGAEENESWMTLSIRYKKPGETKSELNEYTVGAGSLTTAPDADFTFACAVTELSLLLRESEYLKTDVTLNSITEMLPDDGGDALRAQFRSLLLMLSGSGKGGERF